MISTASTQLLGPGVSSVFLSLFLGFFYQPICESSILQATPGKVLFGLRVTDLNGERISIQTATIRYLVRTISAVLFCLGFLLVFFTKKKQTLHDLAARTLVLEGAIENIPGWQAWFAQIQSVFLFLRQSSVSTKMKIAIPLAIITAACWYSANRPPLPPETQFENLLETSPSYGCTQLIVSSYKYKKSVRDYKEETKKKYSQHPEVLKKLEIDNRDNVFYDAEIHKQIESEIKAVESLKQTEQITALTGPFKNLLASKKKAFYLTCENLQLRLFKKCLQQNTSKQTIVNCSTTAIKNSDEFKALFSRI